MGNWKRQMEVIKESKEKEKTSREILGKYFYDLSKLAFGARILNSSNYWNISNSEFSIPWV